MLPAGTYENARITGSALVKNKANPDLFDIEIYFVAEGDTTTAWLFTSDAAWPHTKRKLRACGFDPDMDALVALNLDGDANPIHGREVRIVIEDQEYPKDSGKFKPRVVQIGDSGGYAGERMSDAEAKDFEARMRRRLTATEGPRAGAPKAPAKPAPRPAPAKRTPPANGDPGPDHEPEAKPWD